MKSLYVMCFLVLSACAGNGGEFDVIQQPPTPQPVDTIQQELAAYNSYRMASGQTVLTQGLSCRLATVPANSSGITGTAQTTVGSFTYNGEFNQPNASANSGLNILPAVLQPLYLQWFVVTCTGFMVFPDNNWHSFALSSDDGSLLSINGTLINNDGNHGITTVNATRFFEQGIYSFSLQYMEGPGGSEALILEMDGNIVSSENFAH